MPPYTRRGDTGSTSLGDGTRVRKASPRVEAYGTIDEANSAVGLALAATDDELLTSWLGFLQQRLFNCSSALANPSSSTASLSPDDIAALERAIDLLDASCEGLRGFILPGGCEVAARLHVARTVVRRAERASDSLAAGEPVEPVVLAFLNRASALLFAAARYANVICGAPEGPWDGSASAPE